MPFKFTFRKNSIVLNQAPELASLPDDSILFNELPSMAMLLIKEDPQKEAIKAFFEDLIRTNSKIASSSFEEKYVLLLKDPKYCEKIVQVIIFAYSESLCRVIDLPSDLPLSEKNHMRLYKEIQARLDIVSSLFNILKSQKTFIDSSDSSAELLPFFFNDIELILKNISLGLHNKGYSDENIEILALYFDKTIKSHMRIANTIIEGCLKLQKEEIEEKNCSASLEHIFIHLYTSLCVIHQARYHLVTGESYKVKKNLDTIKQKLEYIQTNFSHFPVERYKEKLEEITDQHLAIMLELESNPQKLYTKLYNQIQSGVKSSKNNSTHTISLLESAEASKLDSTIRYHIAVLNRQKTLNLKQVVEALKVVNSLHSMDKKLPESLLKLNSDLIAELNTVLKMDKGNLLVLRTRSYLKKISAAIQKKSDCSLSTQTNEPESKIEPKVQAVNHKKKKKKKHTKTEEESSYIKLMREKIHSLELKNRVYKQNLASQHNHEAILLTNREKIKALKKSFENEQTRISSLTKDYQADTAAHTEALTRQDRIIEKLKKQKEKLLLEKLEIKAQTEAYIDKKNYLDKQKTRLEALTEKIAEMKSSLETYAIQLRDCEKSLEALKLIKLGNPSSQPLEDEEISTLKTSIQSLQSENENQKNLHADIAQKIEELESKKTYLNIFPPALPVIIAPVASAVVPLPPFNSAAMMMPPPIVFTEKTGHRGSQRNKLKKTKNK